MDVYQLWSPAGGRLLGTKPGHSRHIKETEREDVTAITRDNAKPEEYTDVGYKLIIQ